MASNSGREASDSGGRPSDWPARSFARPTTGPNEPEHRHTSSTVSLGSRQPTRSKRPLWRIIVGGALIAIGLVTAVGGLASFLSGSLLDAPGGGLTFAYFLGQVLGFLLVIVLPLALGIWMVAKPGKLVWPEVNSDDWG